jgi:hypothetical protein
MQKMRKILVVAVAALTVGLIGYVSAIDLEWTNDPNVATAPGGVAPPGNYDDDPAIGAMVQLIRDVALNGRNAPTYGGAGTGLTGDDTLLAWSFSGEAFASGGGLWYANTAGITSNHTIYVRVFDLPSSAAGNLPTPYNYALDGNFAAIDALYNSQFALAGTTVGTFYFDAHLQIAGQFGNPDLGQFNYDWAGPAQNGWTFLPSTVIPEPSTFLLAGLGCLLFVIRKLRAK